MASLGSNTSVTGVIERLTKGPGYVTQYTVKRPYSIPDEFHVADVPGLTYCQLCAVGLDKVRLLAFWLSEDEVRKNEGCFIDKVKLPAGYSAEAGHYVTGAFNRPHLSKRILAGFLTVPKVITVLTAILGVTWAIFSEHYVRFFSSPNLTMSPQQHEVVDVPVGSPVKVIFEVKNVDLYAPSVVALSPPKSLVITGNAENGMAVRDPLSKTVCSLGVGETRSLTVEIVGTNPGEYKVEIGGSAHAGLFRSAAPILAGCRVKVWPEVAHVVQGTRHSSARACTVEGTVSLGRSTDKVWRGEAILRQHPKIRFVGASFHGYELIGELWSSPADVKSVQGIAWMSEGLPAFQAVPFSVDVTSEEDLSQSQWEELSKSIEFGFSTVQR